MQSKKLLANVINDSWKRSSILDRVVDLVVFLVLLFALLLLAGCKTPTRKEIQANLWLVESLPAELCAKVPELQNFGVSRKLNDGSEEYFPYCDKRIESFFGIHETDLQRLLDAYLPEPPPNVQ